jgi:hypothetical protein
VRTHFAKFDTPAGRVRLVHHDDGKLSFACLSHLVRELGAVRSTPRAPVQVEKEMGLVSRSHARLEEAETDRVCHCADGRSALLTWRVILW